MYSLPFFKNQDNLSHKEKKLTNLKKNRQVSSDSASKACQEIQTRSMEYLSKVNKLFNSNLKINFDSDDVGYRNGTVDFGCNSIVLRVFHEQPDCIYGILGHEISHYLLPHDLLNDEYDKNLDWHDQFYNKAEEYIERTSEYSSYLQYQIYHLNMDMLAAKLMKHFGIPKKKISSCINLFWNDAAKDDGYVGKYISKDKVIQYSKAAIPEIISVSEQAYDEGWKSWKDLKLTGPICFKHFSNICNKKNAFLEKEFCDEINVLTNSSYQKKNIFQELKLENYEDKLRNNNCILPVASDIKKSFDNTSKSYINGVSALEGM